MVRVERLTQSRQNDPPIHRAATPLITFEASGDSGSRPVRPWFAFVTCDPGDAGDVRRAKEC